MMALIQRAAIGLVAAGGIAAGYLGYDTLNGGDQPQTYTPSELQCQVNTQGTLDCLLPEMPKGSLK